jgi:hypothetical protein
MNPLASTDDVGNVWRPVADSEISRVEWLISVASSKLRQQCPFDIDARIALYASDPKAPTALDPLTVASVVATIVKRFLVNQGGVVSQSEGAGPFSTSQTFVSRYDKAGADVRGAIVVTPADVDELRPATPTRIPAALQLVPTRAMQPEPGFWPGGFRPRLDPVTGDPVFGLGDLPRYALTNGQPFGTPITLYRSATLVYGTEYRVTGTQAVALALPTGPAGSTVRVRVLDDYTGPPVTVTPPAGVLFATGDTRYQMATGTDRRFTYDGSAIQVI